jgi:predicted nucleic acid-binding Zn ribbon protein
MAECKGECGSDKILARGYCGRCYHKLWRNKNIPKVHRESCSVDDCEEPFYCRDYCKFHYSKWYYRMKIGENFTPKIKKEKVIKIKTCTMCGGEVPPGRRAYCSTKCYNKRIMGYEKLNVENLEKLRGEAIILLTKWKLGYIEPILLFRIVNLYIELFGLTFMVQRVNRPQVTCEECLKQIKKAYNFQ